MQDKARQARLLAAFHRLSGANQELVLKVSEVIQEAKQETSPEPYPPAIAQGICRNEQSIRL